MAHARKHHTKKSRHPHEHEDVHVKKGRRLAHGYETVKGKKNKLYKKGGMFKFIPCP